MDDKLQAMELLDAKQQPWVDLSQNPEQVQQGQASFQSWDDAIGGLRADRGDI